MWKVDAQTSTPPSSAALHDVRCGTSIQTRHPPPSCNPPHDATTPPPSHPSRLAHPVSAVCAPGIVMSASYSAQALHHAPGRFVVPRRSSIRRPGRGLRQSKIRQSGVGGACETYNVKILIPLASTAGVWLMGGSARPDVGITACDPERSGGGGPPCAILSTSHEPDPCLSSPTK